MGYSVTCDWCRRIIKETKTPSEIRGMLQEGEVVCDQCKGKIQELTDFYQKRKDGYVLKLDRVHNVAQKELEKFIKAGGHTEDGNDSRNLGESDKDISGR